MVKTVQGSLKAEGLRFGLVLPRFNEIFGHRLLSGAVDCLTRHGASENDLTVVRVPGCFELPVAARGLASSADVHAVLALGVLIRGATSHYDNICREMVRGLTSTSTEHDIPVIYGVVTAESQEQAMERCGGKAGNRGWDAALGAIEMANLMQELRPSKRRKSR